jgi:chemotaxis protein CheC
MSAFNLNEDQQDCLQEIINIAMGQAGDQLARYLDTFVYLKVPSIEPINTTSLAASLCTDQAPMSIVSQGFFGYEGVRGESLLVYQHKDSGIIGDILGCEPGELSLEEQIVDLSSILTTTFLNVFAGQINNQMAYSAPKLLSSGEDSLAEYLGQLSFNCDVALKVKITYQVTDFSFNCDMFLLIPELAMIHIKKVIDNILESY